MAEPISPPMLQLINDMASGLPMHQIMRRNESADGHKVIVPGDVTWLPSSDWPGHVVVSQNFREVRIIAIIAKVRRNGAFKRLVRGIIEAGLQPVVIEPMFDMPLILRRWGWSGHTVETPSGREEQWRPSAISNPK